MNKTSLTLEANSEGYSEPCQTSKIDASFTENFAEKFGPIKKYWA